MINCSAAQEDSFMSLFFWKKNQKIDEFALQLANHFFKIVPPEKIASEKNMRKTLKKLDRELGKIFSKLSSFDTQNKLGIYTRARLQNKFNHRLEELGYAPEFVKVLNDKMLVQSLQKATA